MTPRFANTFGVPLEHATQFTDRLASTQPSGRVGQPTDIAAVCLRSEESSFTTGAIVPGDGRAAAITQSSLPTEALQAATDLNNQQAAKA